MTKTPVLFTPNGDGYDIQPAGVLLLLANEVWETPNPRLQRFVLMFLGAARAGGYTQCGILETLLAQGVTSHRVILMAVSACNAAGPEAIGRIFAAMRNKG